MYDYFFHEDYQRACDKLCEALRECGRYRDLVRIEFVPLPDNSAEPSQAICWFNSTKATVNIRCDDVWGMVWDIINHLNDIIERRRNWG
jgi:hypothetical protein